MKIAIAAAVFIIGAGILGFAFSPTDEQKRPLSPEPGTGGDAHNDHGQHH